MPNSRVTQIGVEVLRSTATPTSRVTQVGVEVLRSRAATLSSGIKMPAKARILLKGGTARSVAIAIKSKTSFKKRNRQPTQVPRSPSPPGGFQT